MNTPIEVFFMCFLEKGHIENTADEIRTLTEREENIFMYSPRDQMVLMRQTKTKNITINAKLLDFSNFWISKGMHRKWQENQTFYC